MLIWGAAGGLGVFATQLCKAAGAQCVGVVSSDEKGELIKRLGAVDYINRNEFAGMMRKGGETPEEDKARFKVSRAFSNRVNEILGEPPDIVFEHVGKATFPTSVLAVKPFGKVVICGAYIFLLREPESALTPWMIVIVVSRELIITGLRSFLENLGANFGAEWLGKIKMVLQCAALFAIFVALEAKKIPDLDPTLRNTCVWARNIFVWSMLIATALSGLQYLWKAFALLRKDNQ